METNTLNIIQKLEDCFGVYNLRKMKGFLVIIRKTILAGMIGVLAMIVASLLIPQSESLSLTNSSLSDYDSIKLIFVEQFFISVVVVYLLKNSNYTGIRLFANLLWVCFGTLAFVMQIETILFIPVFPTLSISDVSLLVLTSFFSILIYLPLVMLLFGKWKKSEQNISEFMFKGNLLYKIPLVAGLFVIIYFLFGYFIAFQFDAVRDFYQNSTIEHNPILFYTIQFFRGILWVIVGMPLLYMFEKKHKAVLACILVYAVFSSIVLLLPNPLMPFEVRFGHFVEIFTSMALFGFVMPHILHSSVVFKNN